MDILRRIYQNKVIFDAIVLFVIGVSVLVWAIDVEAFEMLAEFVEEHEDWQADEYVTTFIFLGLTGFIYGVRRIIEARREIKRRNIAERSVDWIANHDMLTKLPNRRRVRAFIKQADAIKSPEERKQYTVCVIDLDGFKKVNDLLGHAGGDELLVKIATRLSEAVPGELVARLGGDEFAVITTDRNNEDPEHMVARLLESICKPAKVGGIHAEVGACIGFARVPRDTVSLEEAMKQADIAMYAAKNTGRNQIVAFQADMKDALAQRAEMEIALQTAIKNEEIVPFYQPQMDLKTGNLTGFEALARWNKNGVESIPPTVFIDMAEDLGVITELSESLLRRACTEAKKWPDHLTLSFNISPTQLSDKLLGLRILKTLGAANFPAHRLEVEITESALIRETETAVKILNDLHDAGVRVAIDDFGTGYSSLSQLSKFQFDRIKIDRSFVSSFESDARQRKIVKAIVALGEGLGISTTAEGIEETGQLDILKEFGCEDGQGYLFGKAIAPSAVDDLLVQLDYKTAPGASKQISA